jgi:hypothetical protein
MFSQLGPLFRTTFRQAEPSDTHLHIPHEERNKNKKKEEDSHNSSQSSDLWEDNTDVTVEALRQFLVNFLKTLPGYTDSENLNFENNQESPSKRPHEKTRPTNTRNAKAVRAYQAMAEQNSSEAAAPVNQSVKPKENPAPTANLLESRELRDIHNLIDDLDVLKNAHIQSLEIRPAETFLESLKNAVRLKKSKI